MKKYKNSLVAVLFTFFALISFSSCESDYYWSEGRMFVESTIIAAPTGSIASDIRLNYDWIRLKNGNGNGYIEDARFLGGYIEIIPYNNSYIDGFDLTLSNSNAILAVDVNGRPGGIIEGRQTDDFLNAVIEVVRRYGYAIIYVDGRASNYAKFDLNFSIDVDAYVRN